MPQPTNSPRHYTISNRVIQYKLFQFRYDLAVARLDRDSTREYNLLVQIASLYAQEKMYAPAIDTFHDALLLARRTENRRVEGGLLCTLGDLCHAAGQRGSALYHYEAGLALARRLGNTRLEAACQDGVNKVRAAVILKHLQQVEDHSTFEERRARLKARARERSQRVAQLSAPSRPVSPQPLWFGFALFFIIFLLLPVLLLQAGVSDSVSAVTVLAASLTGLYWYRNTTR